MVGSESHLMDEAACKYASPMPSCPHSIKDVDLEMNFPKFYLPINQRKMIQTGNKLHGDDYE